MYVIRNSSDDFRVNIFSLGQHGYVTMDVLVDVAVAVAVAVAAAFAASDVAVEVADDVDERRRANLSDRLDKT